MFALPVSTLRVRQILDGLSPSEKKVLKKLLPEAELGVPDLETRPYPSMLLSCLPKGEAYSALGLIAEGLLRVDWQQITVDTLISMSKPFGLTAEGEAKVRKSTTTQPFLNSLISTRKGIEKVLDTSTPLLFEEEVRDETVSAHPDMYNAKQVFEVKLTGMMKENWLSFLFQVFAYGSLLPEVKELYLVLPLQRALWKADITGWTNRKKYRDFLVSAAKQRLATAPKMDPFMAMLSQALAAEGIQFIGLNDLGDEMNVPVDLATAVCPSECASGLCEKHHIGSHIGKKKTLLETVSSIRDASRPYQIFVGSTQSSKVKFDEKDCAAAKKVVEQRGLKIFVHAPYIINLSNPTEDWHVELMKKNLQIGVAMGAKGVVIHVGKSTKQKVEDAMARQTSAIQKSMVAATPECPLLLETPAGQGTELLTDMKQFIDYVESFKDPRVRMCMDTCHVFATGANPYDYLKAALGRKDLLKLVHYNDSNGVCGSCVDRHALVGTGHIGIQVMTKVAEECEKNGIPMVIE